jgi:DNA polymerase-3 subunit alpha
MIHLHTHSIYSVRDALASPDEMVAKAAEYGMQAIALTDHGSMAGLPRFVEAAKVHNIKPILGCEFYMVDNLEQLNTRPYHIVLLAKNHEGYNNLVKLNNLAHLQGFYYKPRITYDWLKEHSKGLVCLTACLRGVVGADLEHTDGVHYLRTDRVYNLFGEDMYFEIQPGNDEQMEHNGKVVEIAKRYGGKVVLSCDVHYLNRDDFETHCILYDIYSGTNKKGERRLMDYANYLAPEMDLSMFDKDPIRNTHEVADKIEAYSIKSRKPYFDITEDDMATLRNLALSGYAGTRGQPRINSGDASKDPYWERLHHELDVIENLKCASFFLLINNVVKTAQDMGIYVGAGRGSVCGSLVAYNLGIHRIDPIKNGLYFERFINPKRVSLPDIDIDVEDAKRGLLVEKLQDIYGIECVMPLGTYSKNALRGAFKDVARYHGLDPAEANKLTKTMPYTSADGVDVDTTKWTSEQIELLEQARRISGTLRQSSKHASGFLIYNKPIRTFLPIHRVKNVICTQYDVESLDMVNLPKVDLLGLRNLSVINNVIDEVGLSSRKVTEDPVDSGVFEYINTGSKAGMFHIETPGAARVAEQIGVKNFPDLVALLAVDRPGVLAQGLLAKYATNKKTQQVRCHEALREILKDTWGVVIYQEQVMKIAQEVAGFTLEQADILRYSIGKKQVKKTQKLKKQFIKGCVENGLSNKDAEDIYNMIEMTTTYLLNKSHATAYATIAYQTAYLKYYYFKPYIKHLLNSVYDDVDKLMQYFSECHLHNIHIKPPDVNNSEVLFSYEPETNHLLYGIGSIKDIGIGTAQKIVDERTRNGAYLSFTDLCDRVKLNKTMLTRLILSGACSQLGTPEELLPLAKSEKKRAIAKAQTKLFDDDKYKSTPKKIDMDEGIYTSLGIHLPKVTLVDFEAYWEDGQITQTDMEASTKRSVRFMGLVTKISQTAKNKVVRVTGLYDKMICLCSILPPELRIGQIVLCEGQYIHGVDTFMIRGNVKVLA